MVARRGFYRSDFFPADQPFAAAGFRNYKCLARVCEKRHGPAIAFNLLLLLVGTCPLLFVSARPDSYFLLHALLILRLCQASRCKPQPRLSRQLLLFLAVIFIVSSGVSLHPIFVLLLPVVIQAVCTATLSPPLKLASIAAFFGLSWQGLAFHSQYFTCPGNRAIAEFLRNYSDKPGDHAPGLAELFSSKILNIINTPELIGSMLPRSRFPYGMLPAVDFSDHRTAISALSSAVIVIVVIIAWTNLRALLSAVKPSGGKNWVSSYHRTLFLSLWASVILMAAALPHKLPYRIVLFFPLLAAASMIAMYSWRGFDRLRETIAASAGGLAGLISAPVMLGLYLPMLAAGSHSDQLPDQSMSVGIFSALTNRDAIEQAKKSCDIPDSSASSLVCVDQLTYWSMQGSIQPFSLRPFLWENASTARELVEELHDLDSGGLIVTCDQLPAEFLAELEAFGLKHFGPICCLNRREISAAAIH